MAGMRLGKPRIVFAVFLLAGCVAFVKRKELMPEVFERNRILREESIEQAAAFREAMRKRRKKDENDN
eukprot:gene184-9811_t